MIEDLKTATKWGLGIVVVVGVVGMAAHFMSVATTVASAPGRVANKTLQTDNIIASYEWFHDVNAQFDSRLAQVKGHASILKAETNPSERSRLTIELAAMRQSCRDLATKYNANSVKVNKSIFKGNTLPETLEQSQCEA